MYEEVKNFIFTTSANTNKNLSSSILSFSQSSVTVGSGSFTTRSYDISLSENTRIYQLYLNLSLDGDIYTAIPCRDRNYAGNSRRISANVSQNVSNLTLTLFLTNPSGSSQTFPAMTVNIAKRDFVDEIN